jgi:hypothetical protein
MTVVELGRSLKDTKAIMSDEERARLLIFLASNPEAGDIIPDTGGVRKVRGARVIYYFHNRDLPLFLLAAYKKNEKSNLSRAERNELKRFVPMLVGSYRPLP